MAQVAVLNQLGPIALICRGCDDTTMTEAYVSAVRELCRTSRWFLYTLNGVSTAAPVLTPYTTGTVTVTNNSANVVGVGTLWVDEIVDGVAQVAAGDTFTSTDGVEYTVLNVTSNTALALTEVYGGATLGGQTYSVGRNRYSTIYNLGSDTYNEIIDVQAIAITATANDIRAMEKRSSARFDPNQPAQRPAYFQYVPENQFVVHPKPDAAYPLSISLVMQPRQGSNSIDDVLMNKWSRAFRCGALRDLLRIPGMKWTDQREAARNEAEFLDWMNRATSASAKREEIPSTPW